MPRLTWSPAARRDLHAIDAFLLERDARAAVRTLQAIRASAGRLLDYPRIGRALDEPFRVLGVRGTPYLLVYRLRGGEVEIIRIRHSRENWLDEPEAEL